MTSSMRIGERSNPKNTTYELNKNSDEKETEQFIHREYMRYTTCD